MCRRYSVSRRRKRSTDRMFFGFKGKLISVFVILLLLLGYLQLKGNELLDNILKEKMQLIGVELLSNAVQTTIDSQQSEYADLVTLTENAQNTLSSVQIDTLSLNKIENQAIQNISKDLSSLSATPIEVPLGAFSGSSFFSGYGPEIPFKIHSVGSVHTKTISSFDSAGVNQTRHRILLNLAVELSCNVLFSQKTATAAYDFVLAETILVGEVPQYYTEVISESDDIVSKINDYGNENWVSSME